MLKILISLPLKALVRLVIGIATLGLVVIKAALVTTTPELKPAIKAILKSSLGFTDAANANVIFGSVMPSQLISRVTASCADLMLFEIRLGQKENNRRALNSYLTLLPGLPQFAGFKGSYINVRSETIGSLYRFERVYLLFGRVGADERYLRTTPDVHAFAAQTRWVALGKPGNEATFARHDRLYGCLSDAHQTTLKRWADMVGPSPEPLRGHRLNPRWLSWSMGHPPELSDPTTRNPSLNYFHAGQESVGMRSIPHMALWGWSRLLNGGWSMQQAPLFGVQGV